MAAEPSATRSIETEKLDDTRIHPQITIRAVAEKDEISHSLSDEEKERMPLEELSGIIVYDNQAKLVGCKKI